MFPFKARVLLKLTQRGVMLLEGPGKPLILGAERERRPPGEEGIGSSFSDLVVRYVEACGLLPFVPRPFSTSPYLMLGKGGLTQAKVAHPGTLGVLNYDVIFDP